jgi:hypothetical protein
MLKKPEPPAPPPLRLSYMPARAKLWIASLDNPELQVRAQYNPKELQIDKAVPWGDHKPNNGRSGHAPGPGRPTPPQADLEFNGKPARSMTVELLFDAYEEGTSIEPDIKLLEELSSVQQPTADEPELRRPHHCVVAWGPANDAMEPFRCVIESLSVKYTMWDRNGLPLRATCTVKLKEAQVMSPSKGLVTAPRKLVRRGRTWDRKKPDELTEDEKRDHDR